MTFLKNAPILTKRQNFIKFEKSSSFMRRFTLASLVLFLITFVTDLAAKTDKYRSMWRDNPSTTMTIGWNQISGANPILYYDTNDFGKEVLSYSYSAQPDRRKQSKGMDNVFVRLENLLPATKYYFVIQDSEGCSERMSFRTAPDNPYERLSIIAGGDSRNYRSARQKANSLVAKLRPHCVMFGGDMTGGDNARQWNAWFDDWQLTISPEGHLTPVIITRGNHEYSNQTLVDLFDVANNDAYYALSLGGDLLRVYTLNSLIPSGGNQKAWLEEDLQSAQNHSWRIAQYHYAIRPHTAKKSERNNQLRDWATLFEQYKVNMAVESDAHCVKWTYPIRPSRGKGSDEGFVRDDVKGTVYVGEGCWGAPLRRNNDDKIWTRNSGSFNQFKWIFIDQDRIEVRTVKTDFADEVTAVDPYDIFRVPDGLELWQPSNGEVVIINKSIGDYAQLVDYGSTPPSDRVMIVGFQVEAIANGVKIKWNTENETGLNKVYNIQRSQDGKDYNTVASMESKGVGDHAYDFVEVLADQTTAELVYRLQEVLPSGRINNYGARTLKWKGSVTEVEPLQGTKVEDSRVATSSTKDLRIKKEITLGNAEPAKKMNKLFPIASGLVQAKYKLEEKSNIEIKLVNREYEVLAKSAYKNLNSGNYLQSIDMRSFPQGQYMLTIEANEELIQQYLVVK